MKNYWKMIKEYFSDPPLGIYIITFLVTCGTIILSVLSFFYNFFANNFTAFLTICCFIIAILGLIYSGMLISRLFKHNSYVKKSLIEWCKNYDVTFFILKNYNKRSIFFMFYFFIMSMCYAAFNLYLGLENASIWYCALAGYHIIFTFLRVTILSYHNKSRPRYGIKTKLEDQEAKAHVYLRCGRLLVVIDIALLVAFLEILIHDEYQQFFMQDLTLFFFAFYTIYKIFRAIINFIKSRGQKDLTIHAEKCFSLTGAGLSFLTFQTAILHKYSNKTTINAQLINSITGSIVLIITLSMGIFMIIRAKRHLKKILKLMEEEK